MHRLHVLRLAKLRRRPDGKTRIFLVYIHMVRAKSGNGVGDWSGRLLDCYDC